jgi:TrpR-related protein YerC/YecD
MTGVFQGVWGMRCTGELLSPHPMIPYLAHRFTHKKPDLSELSQAFKPLKSIHEFESLLKDLCTDQELRLIMERWSIANLIHLGFPYRVISIKTGASSATIARVAQTLSASSGELQRACKRRAMNIRQSAHD